MKDLQQWASQSGKMYKNLSLYANSTKLPLMLPWCSFGELKIRLSILLNNQMKHPILNLRILDFLHEKVSNIWNLCISLTSLNNQFSEFRILNIYNKILYTCLINIRERHSEIYIMKSGNLFYFFLNLKEASKCVLRIIKKIKTKISL